MGMVDPAPRFGYVADNVTASVISSRSARTTLKKAKMVKAVLVRSRKPITPNPDGSPIVRFETTMQQWVIDNLKNKNPIATRVLGSIPREIKDAGYAKIASQAQCSNTY